MATGVAPDVVTFEIGPFVRLDESVDGSVAALAKPLDPLCVLKVVAARPVLIKIRHRHAHAMLLSREGYNVADFKLSRVKCADHAIWDKYLVVVVIRGGRGWWGGRSWWGGRG